MIVAMIIGLNARVKVSHVRGNAGNIHARFCIGDSDIKIAFVGLVTSPASHVSAMTSVRNMGTVAPTMIRKRDGNVKFEFL